MRTALLLFLAAATVGMAEAQLTIFETPDALTISSSRAPTWSVTVDLKQGGAITELHIPRNGPNLVNRGSSLFNLFAMTSEKVDGRTIKAWSRSNGRLESTKVDKSGDSIVVAIAAKAMSRKNENFFNYRHTYTFRPGGILLDGEALWQFPDTRMSDSSMGFDIAADTFCHPVRLMSGGKPPLELDVTTSGGTYFPEGVGYPMNAEFRLRNGRAFVLRALEVPEVYRSNPRFIYEKPWQAGWAGRWYWEGDADGKTRTGEKPASYVQGQPIHYRFELAVDPPRSGNEPPMTIITSPVRDSRYYHVGETVVLRGQSIDKEDGPLPADRLNWEVFGTSSRKKIIQTGSGPNISFTFPPDTPRNQDYTQFVIKLSAKDSQGAEGVDYITLGATPPSPPSPVISGIEFDFAERVTLGRGSLATLTVASGIPPAVKLKRLASLPGAVTGIASVPGGFHAIVTTQPGLPPVVGLASSQNLESRWELSDFRFPGEAPFYPVIFTDGSPDDYLYLWGSTWPKGTEPCYTCRSAYLARVPKLKAADRRAWEFFSYMKAGRPLWAADARRNFDSIADADGADVIAATYNPTLERYLTVVATGTGYTFLDSAQPWGNYTTIATMKTWGDIKPGSNLKLVIPSKWISADGRTFWAAYSTGGEIKLVRGTLTLKEGKAK